MLFIDDLVDKSLADGSEVFGAQLGSDALHVR